MAVSQLVSWAATAISATVFCPGGGSILPDALGLKGLTCSVGVASLKQHISNDMGPEQAKSTLLRLADSAMYVAKETGRNLTAVAGKPVPRSAPAASVARRRRA